MCKICDMLGIDAFSVHHEVINNEAKTAPKEAPKPLSEKEYLNNIIESSRKRLKEINEQENERKVALCIKVSDIRFLSILLGDFERRACKRPSDLSRYLSSFNLQ